MKIKKTEFIKSSTSIKECPIKGLPGQKKRNLMQEINSILNTFEI